MVEGRRLMMMFGNFAVAFAGLLRGCGKVHVGLVDSHKFPRVFCMFGFSEPSNV